LNKRIKNLCTEVGPNGNSKEESGKEARKKESCEKSSKEKSCEEESCKKEVRTIVHASSEKEGLISPLFLYSACFIRHSLLSFILKTPYLLPFA
jgi:hypothetical protein